MKRIAYPGVPGSFSEQALTQYFPGSAKKTNVKQFEEIFTLLANNEIDYGVLPIENSSTGGIFEVFDFLKQYNFYIVGETFIHVTHHLLGTSGTTLASIQAVYSHPQGFGQSRVFLKQYPHWIETPYYNTAISAEYVSQVKDITKAAIASKRAGELYGLDVIQANIQDVNHNYTRFVIISRNLEVKVTDTKISLLYALPNSVGALYNSLGIFARYNIDLLNLQSRPIKDKPWECYFYLDLVGNLDKDNVKAALLEIEKISYSLQILGSYSASDDNGGSISSSKKGSS